MCRRSDIREGRHEPLVDDGPLSGLITLKANEAIGLVDNRYRHAVDRVGACCIDAECLGGRTVTTLVDDDEARPGRIGARLGQGDDARRGDHGVGHHAIRRQNGVASVTDTRSRICDNFVQAGRGMAASERPVVDDETVVGCIHHRFALRAGERCDLARCAASKLKLLAQGTVPRLMVSTTASFVEPKSSESVTAAVRSPRSAGKPISSCAAIGLMVGTTIAPRSNEAPDASASAPRSSESVGVSTIWPRSSGNPV